MLNLDPKYVELIQAIVAAILGFFGGRVSRKGKSGNS